MKYYIFTLLILCTTFGQAQDNEKVTSRACDCISQIEQGTTSKEAQYAEVKECIESAITVEQMMSSLTKISETVENQETDEIPDSLQQSEFNVVIDASKDYKTIEEMVLRDCEALKKIMTINDTMSPVSISEKKRAQKLYGKGMEVYREQNYGEAIKYFKKALKKDVYFAFAWDMLGASYRKQNKFEEAIEAYNNSLQIDPNGRMPLMNKPIAYSLAGNNNKAIEGYNEFIRVFPDDAEGYYGIARIYHMEGDYENAVDLMMKALVLYNQVSSPYARDAEQNLVLYYKELKKKNQLDLFERMAEKHNISIGGN